MPILISRFRDDWGGGGLSFDLGLHERLVQIDVSFAWKCVYVYIFMVYMCMVRLFMF